MHLSGALSTVAKGIVGSKTVEQIVSDLEPAAFTVLEYASNFFFPPLGTVEALIVLMIEHSETMNQEQTNAWMDRASASNTSG